MTASVPDLAEIRARVEAVLNSERFTYSDQYSRPQISAEAREAILEALDVMGDPDRFDTRHHPCGCVTYFDLALWRSVTQIACTEHAPTPEVEAGERETPTFAEQMMAKNYGICPRCGEHKFIGHGPLCSDCFVAPSQSPQGSELGDA